MPIFKSIGLIHTPGFPGFIGGIWTLLETGDGRRFALADVGSAGIYGLAELNPKLIEDAGQSKTPGSIRYIYRTEPIAWARTNASGLWNIENPLGFESCDLLMTLANIWAEEHSR